MTETIEPLKKALRPAYSASQKRKKMDEEDTLVIDSPKELGVRLRLLRKTAKLTVRQFVEVTGVSYPSVSYWENGTLDHPFKQKSMEKVLTGLKNIAMTITPDWLLAGKGANPVYQGKEIIWERPAVLEESKEGDTQLATVFADEMKLFASLSDAVIANVDHDYLAPFLNKTDFVGGIWKTPSKITETTLCIFRLEEKQYIAYITPRKKKDHFDAFYPKTSFISPPPELTLKNVLLTKVAPIIRFWRLVV